MIRLFFSGFFFVILAIIQISFLHSLPWAFSATPLVFAFSTYLIQHRSLTLGIWWIIIFGFCLDLIKIGITPHEIISYTLGAIVAYSSARRLFSNRSFYGILACGIISYMTLIVSEIIILSIYSLTSLTHISWTNFTEYAVWSSSMLIVVLMILFVFAAKIRRLLFRSFILSKTQETF
ncbi:rod shape-determining protein MreD [Patescibacteria group bacterium]